MRIAVFEWLCGGGMLGQRPEQIPASLLLEGWAMLSTLARQLHAADHEVVTVIDHRLVTPSQIASLPAVHSGRFEEDSRILVSTAVENTIKAWHTCVDDSAGDLALIIAPEIDGILQQVIASFQINRVPTLNCSGAFLSRSCDKWLTALILENSKVPHPLTRLASDWSSCSVDSRNQWCLKSRLGAGCEGMWIGRLEDLILKIENLSDPTNWIVQPWLVGAAFSCSAIVDCHGNATWLPLVTQSFDALPEGSSQMLQYRGGKIVDPGSGLQRPDELLQDLLSTLCSTNGEALGWIGVDLLLQPNGRWVVIEVNPRLTTSILGLSQAAPYNLAQSMIEAFAGVDTSSTRAARGVWQLVEFSPGSL